MKDLIPEAQYTAPDVDNPVSITVGEGPHTTNGKTTQISDIVIQSGGEDRDKPTPASNTELGALRARITTLQDNINIFLTERMQKTSSKDSKSSKQDVERRILDDGVDEDDDN